MPDGDRKFSLGSDTDKELQKKQAFSEKRMEQMGSPVDPNQSGIGFACRKGLKPESPNQDSWVVLKMGDWSMYGVFDGHGKMGHHVSNFVKEALPKLIVKDSRFRSDDDSDYPKMFAECYKRCQNMVAAATRLQKIDALMSGCTTTVVIHDHKKNKLFVSWAGDSGSGLCVEPAKAGDNFFCNKLTWDHKPEVKEERARIEGSGGRVVFDGYANHRVYAKGGRYPGLNMSRALGDLMGHTDAGISAEPSVKIHTITPTEKMLMVCSDGVWEFLSDDECAAIAGKYPKEKAMEAAQMLAKEAWERWIREEGGMVVDDITAVIVYV